MKVEIMIPRAQYGEFSKIKLSYLDSENNEITVPLNIIYDNIYEFTNKKNGIAFDLFLIGCLVYGIDIFLPRSEFSYDGWSRDIEVSFPVENPVVFDNAKETLETLLKFLTGDDWSISFIQRDEAIMYYPKENLVVNNDRARSIYKRVSLFSGGMDSLIGIIDELHRSNDKIILASHYDSVFKGAKADQDRIYTILATKRTNFDLIQTRVDLSINDTNGVSRKNESSLRSRSFLFLSYAILLANSIEDGIEILIPENGTISLNHPLTPSRSSSCSTRTAHPFYLTKFNEFILELELNHQIINKYELKTKGEMLKLCSNRQLILDLYRFSTSCAKRGHNVHWDNRSGSHCGICMPSIYTRVALHSIGLDNEAIGTDLFNPINFSLDDLKTDVIAFIDYLKTSLTIEEIGRNLLVNGSLPLDRIEQYASVVVRSREQIMDWIRDKGSVDIKTKLGI